MATFQEQLVKAKRLSPKKLEIALFKYIKTLDSELIKIQQDRIFNESKDIFGNALGFYSKATEILSKGRKKAGEPFTGFDTGEFFKGFYGYYSNEEVQFFSRDEKTITILRSEHWLSDELFGLTDEELKKVIADKLLPFFIETYRNILEI